MAESISLNPGYLVTIDKMVTKESVSQADLETTRLVVKHNTPTEIVLAIVGAVLLVINIATLVFVLIYSQKLSIARQTISDPYPHCGRDL